MGFGYGPDCVGICREIQLILRGCVPAWVVKLFCFWIPGSRAFYREDAAP